MLVQLDKRFKYDDCVEMPRAPEKMEKFLHGSTRRGDQSLMQYCADHREARRNLEKHKITLPYTASGWLLLRRSSLTYEQRQMVQTQCASLEEVKVEEAMYYHVLPLRPRLSWTQRRSMGSQCTIKLHQRWPPRQHAYAVEEAREMDDDELWRRTPTRTSAKTEDAFYEEAMDHEYDTTREGHGADDNAEETYYQSDELRGDYDEAMEEPTWTQGANSPIFVLPEGTSTLWHLLLMQLLVVQQLNSQFLLAARRHNAQVGHQLRKEIHRRPSTSMFGATEGRAPRRQS